MEFLFAHFIERGIDTIVNINHYDSNNARFVAASCAKTGMKYHWVAYDMVDAPSCRQHANRTPRRRQPSTASRTNRPQNPSPKKSTLEKPKTAETPPSSPTTPSTTSPA